MPHIRAAAVNQLSLLQSPGAKATAETLKSQPDFAFRVTVRREKRGQAERELGIKKTAQRK